jgi:hypothetical protein
MKANIKLAGDKPPPEFFAKFNEADGIESRRGAYADGRAGYSMEHIRSGNSLRG